MDVSPDLIEKALTMLASAAAAYGGIRADIRAQRREIERAQRTADQAHQRLNNIFDRRST
ncbi:hypothetical protein GWL_18180 [Herbaspirillum sp. GW103]|uniref:hypothetical protein n=1 Tax=Herbaspirillum sp. GW103 TaxID=1175306 RepID=UPI00025E2EB8|nr:hypothetical protein [Herbaspirillum sp. GW103]EIJ47577.1 hypothetical protein GWL_18180 [Herbaspirillum sp. GW103]